MRALFVGELQEDLLAFGVLEPFAVALEEPVRRRARTGCRSCSACRSSTPCADLFGRRREQAVGGALEEQERRPRLELRVLLPAARW